MIGNLEKEIADNNKKIINDMDDIDIFLDIIKQYQHSGLDLLLGYEKDGINAWERLVFNDPDNPFYDLLEEKTQDVLV